jgi:hypothetical protein
LSCCTLNLLPSKFRDWHGDFHQGCKELVGFHYQVNLAVHDTIQQVNWAKSGYTLGFETGWCLQLAAVGHIEAQSKPTIISSSDIRLDCGSSCLQNSAFVAFRAKKQEPEQIAFTSKMVY